MSNHALSPSLPGLSAELALRPTTTRQTPLPASRQFRAALEDGARGLLSSSLAMQTFVPGGGMASAALRGTSGAAASPESPSGAAIPTGDQNLRYLELQQQISDESLRFTTLSNVLKARHETAKTAANNIR